MKLFPSYNSPNAVKPWHVPLSTARLSTLFDPSWDLTIARIAAYIDGVNSVEAISQMSNTDIDLTRDAVAHLQYYGCLILLDLFQLSAEYAPTASIGSIFMDEVLQSECAGYVASHGEAIHRNIILELYASLGHGQTLKTWCVDNATNLGRVDVRRFITFGIIKGFLYRVQKYPVKSALTGPGRKDTWASHPVTETEGESILAPIPQDNHLAAYLDGRHCFDQICTQKRVSEQMVMAELRNFSDVQIVYR